MKMKEFGPQEGRVPALPPGIRQCQVPFIFELQIQLKYTVYT